MAVVDWGGRWTGRSWEEVHNRAHFIAGAGIKLAICIFLTLWLWLRRWSTIFGSTISVRS